MDQQGRVFSVLIIGCGAIAGGYDAENMQSPDILTHAKAFQTHPGFEMVACVDPDGDKAQEFSGKWAIPKHYTMLSEALRAQKYDIISICSPTASHEACLREIESHGAKLVFCEKPITGDISSARLMVQRFRHKMVVNYLRRWDPALISLAGEIASGKYGKLISAQAHYNKGLYNNGSHMIDLLGMFFGDLTVVSAGRPVYDFWPDDASLDARLLTKEGQPIEFVGGDVREGMRFDLYLRFEKAKISLEKFSDHIRMEFADGHIETRKSSLSRGMYQAVSNIYDHLVKDEKLLSTQENGLKAMEVCADIRIKAGLEG